MPLELEHRRLFASDALLGRVTDFISHQSAGGTHIYAALEASANIARFDLTEGRDARAQGDLDIPLRATPMRPLDLEIIGESSAARLVVSDTRSTQIETVALSSSGALMSSTSLTLSGATGTFTSQIAQINVGSQTFIATGSRDTGGVQVFAQTATATAVHRDTVEDHGKTALADTADLVTITVGDSSFLVSGSATDGGISTFRVDPSGQTTLVDTVGVKQELWMSGLDDLATVEAAGTSYVVIAATNSSSLSLVRINEMGVMFVTDHIIDDRDSRFSNVDAIDSFEVGNRGFVVAGGSDDGVSLLEILPNGTFFQHGSLANEAGGRLESISALEAVVTGGEVQVFAGSTRGDITQLALDTGNMGDARMATGPGTLSGTAADDLLIGSTGNDRLLGGTGDDVMVGGGGADVMTGGAGADVFVFGEGANTTSRIMDFTLGEDMIDIGDWGRIYHISSVAIQGRSNGADIYYGNQVLRLNTPDDSALDAELLADSLIF